MCAVAVFAAASSSAVAAPLTTGHVQRHVLPAPSLNRFDQFGYAVAIARTTAVVGVRWATVKQGGTKLKAGTAYVYGEDGGQWTQEAELVASDPSANAQFGSAVAISPTGSTIVVGGGNAAYVFQRTGATWAQTARLHASRTSGAENFGESVGVSRSEVVVGADATNGFEGAAYIFSLSGKPRGVLTPGDLAYTAAFGVSVAISGTNLVVGADGSSTSHGMAYVYARSGGHWTLEEELSDPTDQLDSDFGYVVAIDGSTLTVSSSNGVYVYEDSGSSWDPEIVLTETQSGIAFGRAVGVSGSTMVIGDETPSHTGLAYVFTNPGTGWVFQRALRPDTSSAWFGASVGVEGNRAIVGDAYSHNVGAAYVYHGNPL